ncbi:hypothetical protein BCR37DRAFT_410034 [Protomyces lactucae-debilis]|uniref:RRM domain-containing protein n=1 Tax=Protomyces lactucae-debilis TaxID=2754530 RepID=A0A1Y2FFI8_PROLT|nr:uncharacterized protein BCR37DRAFT_410034 [Protomyces lactucae-debilis]ORY82689.1 hypothetical protein BCR37DRAFT_410034 [Protomyces lactucae-debilis]
MDIDLEQLADAPYQKKQTSASPPSQRQQHDEDRHVRPTSNGPSPDSRARSRSRHDDRGDRRSHERSRDRYARDDYRHRDDSRRRSDHRRRSRSPTRGSRHYDDDRDRRGSSHTRYRSSRDDYSSNSRRPRSPVREKTPELTEAERDQRTVFVQQLAARLRTKELIRFFEQAGPVRDAQIVKDRLSGRSKGVGYVEFKSAETVPTALAMTGQLLLGLPIIAQLTEAEKNRQAREGAMTTKSQAAPPMPDAPFHRLYIGNVHFNIGEDDLRAVFEPFGEIQHASLQIDGDTGRSRGFGFVQFKDAAHAREALETMNGFELAGRAIRVGFGNDNIKVGTDAASTAALASAASAALAPPSASNRHQEGAYSSNDFSRDGRRESGRRRDRDERDGGSGRRQKDVLDDGRNGYQNISRTELMRKLARAEDGIHAQPAPHLVDHAKAPEVARGILLKNMFNPAEETGDSWTTELAEDVKAECEEKYGPVVHIHVEEHSLGEIYIKFKTMEGGKKAIQGLNGRWFGGRTIGASPLLDAIYHTKFPETKQL